MTNIILFGEMGSGKSTVAKIFNQLYGHEIKSLGSKIHQECNLHGHETREEMQSYGQMMRKIFGKDIWCNYLYNNLEKNKPIIIDDARQLNEYNFFNSIGFIPIGITASEELRLSRLQERVNYVINKATEQHETEIQARECVEKCFYTIENNGNIENLIIKIKNMRLYLI